MDSSDGSAAVAAPQAAPPHLERVHRPPYECVSLQHLSKARCWTTAQSLCGDVLVTSLKREACSYSDIAAMMISVMMWLVLASKCCSMHGAAHRM